MPGGVAGHQPIAIVFDFVNPVPLLWGLLCRRGKLGLDKSKPVMYAKHGDVLARILSQAK